MNDDDIRWLNWIASTLYEEANRERMTRLVTTLTADLGRAREAADRLLDEWNRYASDDSLVAPQPALVIAIKDIAQALRPAAKDGGDANVL